MKTLIAILILAAGALHAQFTVTSGQIPAGYADLTQKTDVSGGGAGAMADDSASSQIMPSGFSFPMFGTHYSGFCIADNGYILMTNGSVYSPYVSAAPDFYSANAPVIAPLWADFWPSGNGYGYGQYGQIGWHFAGGVLTVEWKYLERKQTGTTQTWPAPGTRMQAILNCTNGEIEFRYGDPDPECWGKNANWNNACSVGYYGSVVPGVDSPAITSTGRVYYYPTERYVRFTPTSLPVHITDVSTLPTGSSGQAYSYQFSAVGGTAPYAWQGTSLPSGWSLSNTGLLTAPASATTVGTNSFTITASDSVSGVHSLGCTLEVTTGPLYITTTSLPHGNAQTAYSCQFAALGGTSPYLWTAQGLPGGWSISTTGLLSAAAADVNWGSFSFDIEVSDYSSPQMVDSGMFTVVVLAPAIQVTTTSVGPFTAGAPASASLFAQGGGGGLAWAGVTLPTGWNLSAAGLLTAAAQYVTAGSHALTVQVSDQAGQTVQANWTVNVVPPGALTITTSQSLPGSNPRTAIAIQFNATGGVSPYTWSATGLPAGWVMSASGVLSAAAASVSPGTHAFSAIVTDGAVPANVVSKACTLVVFPWPALQLSTTTLPDGVIGQQYTPSISVNGGTGGGFNWNLVSGTLPTGISASFGAGAAVGFSGTPATSGTYSFVISVSDDGGNAVTQPMSITVSAQSVTGPGSNGGSGGGSGGCAAGATTGNWLLALVLAPLALLRPFGRLRTGSRKS